MSEQSKRVLIVGRSAAVLEETVALLRERGYGANASNQFDRLLNDYDPRELDLVIFGGMVPPERREQLRTEIRELNPQVSFLQGLGGIAPLLVAQVQEFFGGTVPGIEHDPGRRVIRVSLPARERVVVEGLWGIFVPPEPVGRSLVVLDDELPAGVHEVAIPDEVPAQASYAAVRVGGRVWVSQIGETPASVRSIAPGSLPAPAPVTTRLPWD